MNGTKRAGAFLLRRAFALLLAALLWAQLIPVPARAVGGYGENVAWETLDNAGKTASTGKTVENTYILEVSSGTRQGGGAADNVLYFIVSYTAADGQKRTTVLVPGEDAVSRGFEAAARQGNREERRDAVKELFGYTTAPLESKIGLSALETDQYMFTTPSAIQTIDKIQIFGRRNEEHGDWSCQGMRIYRVDTLYGLEMYGWYSDKGYIDFSGQVIANVKMPSGGVTFRWKSSAGMYELTSNTLNAKLENGPGAVHESQTGNRLVFRIDFADVAGAGFDALCGLYTETGGRTKISDLKYCEVGALTIRYTDVYGCIREVCLPLVINALGQIMEVLGDVEIAEFAQPGDTIAVPVMLPCFRSLNTVYLTLGEEQAAEAAHLVTGTVVSRSSRNVPVAGGIFILESPYLSGKVLTVDGGAHSGVNVAAAGYTGSGTQRWKLVDAGDGYYFLAAAENDSLVLDVTGGKASNGANIALYTRKSSGTENEKWKLVEAGNGYYSLVSAMDNGYCVDLQASTERNVQLYQNSKSDNQKWKFTNVSLDSLTSRVVLEDPTVKNDRTRAARVKKSAGDAVSYLCFAAYREVTVQVGLEGATLRTRFTGGNPLQMATATSAEGVPLPASQTSAFLLRDYTPGTPLVPRDRSERYLVTLTTDNVPNAGTAGDVYIQFDYISIQNKELTSAEYKVRDYVREFYGEWPGSTSDFAYNYGLRDGGTVQFMIPLQGVKEFRNVSVRVSGEDEWQFTGISVSMVKSSDPETGEKSYSPRLADWKEIAVTGLNNHPRGLYSHLSYSRVVELATKEPALLVGKVYEDEGERPDPTDPDSEWVPGSLVQDDGETYVFNGETQEVTTKEDVPWDKLRHYMTFKDTQQDLGFTKERCVYTVSVQVAGKTVNVNNDDCGSKNLFYFRLIFENGNSGCTLANQQIVGDAFGTGELVQFKIPTSQDYGEVLAVQVIPDSQDSNSDIYDKLQIEEISVTRDTVGAVSPTWTAKVSTASDEGWVGIDYRDPGETSSKGGAEGRTLTELATTFPITETSYSTNLLVSITTASYETGVQFTGGIGMDLNFINAEGRTDPNPVSGFDVVGAMNSYGGLAGSKVRKYKVGTETKTENAHYYVSDTRYQFLPGATDSFIVTIKNVYQLTDMTLNVMSDVITHWTVKDVNIYQLNGQGIRYLNPAGAYAYRYLPGQEPTLVARWATDRVTTPLVVYDAANNTSNQTISFALDSETIKLSADAAKWSSTITRAPNSKNDTLNLILYPTTENGAAKPKDYEVTAAVKYTDSMTLQTLQVSTGQMLKGTDSNGNTVFYAIGLGASNLDAIVGVDWSATTMRLAQPMIPSGLLQVVRGGVIIDSYPLAGMGYSMGTAVEAVPSGTQRLFLQVSDDTVKQTLKAEDKDLAAALYFRSDDPSGSEYRSQYIFLSDLYDEIRPGQLLELDYSLRNVGQLTAVNLVTVGGLDLKIENAYLADMRSDGSLRSEAAIRNGAVPTATPERLNLSGDVSLLTLELKTAQDVSGVASGTSGPVRMNVGYYDIYGAARTKTVENIRQYTPAGDNAFSGGNTDTVSLLISDFGELRWIELEPWHEPTALELAGERTGDPASWKLESVTAAVGLDGRGIRREADTLILEGSPLRIGLSDVTLIGTATYKAEADASEGTASAEPEEKTEVTLFTGDTKAIRLDSGAKVDMSIRLSGSDEGYTVTLQTVDPETGELRRAYLDETHGYTEEELKELLSEAEASLQYGITEAERKAAQAVADAVKELMKTTGDFQLSARNNTFTFTPPRNYTGSRITYRLTVSAKEIPEASISLDIAVKSEDDPLAMVLGAWQDVRTVGVLTVRNGEGAVQDTVSVPYGGTLQQILRSGETLEIVTHGLKDTVTYEAAIRGYDPVSGATGQAELEETHGYTREKLEQLKTAAQAYMSDPQSSSELLSAAKELLEAIEAVSDTAGSFTGDAGRIVFSAPRNYTGGILYYRISLSAEGSAAVLTVDVSLRPEDNRLSAAVDKYEAAVSSDLLARQIAAMQESAIAAGNSGSGADTGSSETGGGDGDTDGQEETPGETGGSAGEAGGEG